MRYALPERRPKNLVSGRFPKTYPIVTIKELPQYENIELSKLWCPHSTRRQLLSLLPAVSGERSYC
jgi:hypothetical protein